MVIDYRYTAWVTAHTLRGGNVQYATLDGAYRIWFLDGQDIHQTDIWLGAVPHAIVAAYSQSQNDSDKAHFEANFMPSANMPVEPKTTDGRLVTRGSVTHRTTSFKLRVISFYTAGPGTIHNVNPVTEQDYGDATMYLFDANGDACDNNEADAVKTVIDWVPAYNYEIIGGFLDIPEVLKGGTTNQWFLSSVGVPDYPPQYYGSVDFISEVNIEAVTVNHVVSDGRAIQYMAYNYGGMPNTNKIRFIIKHPMGNQKRFQLYLEHFV